MSTPSAFKAIAVIPARLESTRFPRKVLADATGYPLVWHAVQRARMCDAVKRVVVATDSQEVASRLEDLDVETVMTKADHPNGTSRLAEAVAALGLGDDELVVNVQGDEPELEPGMITEALRVMVELGSPVGTVASPLREFAAFMNPSVVKVVRDQRGMAMYFSRSPIPLERDGQHTTDSFANSSVPRLRHVGLYTYTPKFLAAYADLVATPLEHAECLEQLRVLEHGFGISVAVWEGPTPDGIDTPGQYAAFVERYHTQKAAQG